MKTYHFPFCFPAKERERARAIKVGGKWTATVYSPASTKQAYEQIRSYILTHYPTYTDFRTDKPLIATITFGLPKSENKADLDNHLKMLDALNKDTARKNNSGFIGLWHDDSQIKEIHARFFYVRNASECFTTITLEVDEEYEDYE